MIKNFDGVPRRSANITNIANTRQYSPILISANIDQSDWPILILKPSLSSSGRIIKTAERNSW